jgi:uncharacterized protein (TIGR01777 family)
LEGLDAVVHLAGESVGARWTARRKANIRRSRVQGTKLLVRSLAGLSQRPRALLCASAVGYYGDTASRVTDESAPPGSGFLAEVCRDWEAEAVSAEEAGMRVVRLRFGMVLDPQGGALAQMLPAFRLGLGGRIGTGRQYVSWITLDEAVTAVCHALEQTDVSGAVNIVAPEPVMQKQFALALAGALHRPAAVPLPAAVVRLLFGEMGDVLLLSSTRAVPAALTRSGYRFRTPDLQSALSTMLRPPARGSG